MIAQIQTRRRGRGKDVGGQSIYQWVVSSMNSTFCHSCSSYNSSSLPSGRSVILFFLPFLWSVSIFCLLCGKSISLLQVGYSFLPYLWVPVFEVAVAKGLPRGQARARAPKPSPCSFSSVGKFSAWWMQTPTNRFTCQSIVRTSFDVWSWTTSKLLSKGSFLELLRLKPRKGRSVGSEVPAPSIPAYWGGMDHQWIQLPSLLIPPSRGLVPTSRPVEENSSQCAYQLLIDLRISYLDRKRANEPPLLSIPTPVSPPVGIN